MNKKFKEETFSKNENPSWQNGKMFNQELNESNLWNLANVYENLSEWTLVGKCLGLNNNDINSVRLRHLKKDGLKECFYQSLLLFRQREPENCNFEYLTRVLATKLDKNSESIKKLESDLFKRKNKNMKNYKKLKFYLNKFIESKNHDEILKRKLTEKDLWKCSGILFPEWKSIGRTLGLTEHELIEIESRYLYTEGIRECCHKSLIEWLQFFYERATIQQLCLHLIDLNLNLFVKQILELLF